MCFFFQAEDGIRDLTVTGVQTCALPISGEPGALGGLDHAVLGAVVAAREHPTRAERRGAVVVEAAAVVLAQLGGAAGIGRASGRERGEISGVAGSLKKKK